MNNDDIYYKNKYLKYKKKYIELKNNNNIKIGGLGGVKLFSSKKKEPHKLYIYYIYNHLVSCNNPNFTNNNNNSNNNCNIVNNIKDAYIKLFNKYKLKENEDYIWTTIELNIDLKDSKLNNVDNFKEDIKINDSIIILFDFSPDFFYLINNNLYSNLIILFNLFQNFNDIKKLFISGNNDIFIKIFNKNPESIPMILSSENINKNINENIKNNIKNSIFIYQNRPYENDYCNLNFKPCISPEFFINIINTQYYSTFINNNDLKKYLDSELISINYYEYTKSGLIKDFIKTYKQHAMTSAVLNAFNQLGKIKNPL
jgi:hypothetical protein